MPAEWTRQDAVILAWPHEGTDWASVLPRAENFYTAFVTALTRYQKVLLLSADPDRVRRHLDGRVNPQMLRILSMPFNDTWVRDYCPLTVYRDGQPLLLDFQFTGWGGKYGAQKDNAVTKQLCAQGVFGDTPCEEVDFILEGGSIESDGQGTVMTTANCLMNPNRRRAGTDRKQVEAVLHRTLGARQFLWLENGGLEGDDTDSHIDILARFAPDDIVLHASCPDPRDPHYPELQKMERELRSFKNHSGKPYRLLPLPWPAARRDDEGRRLPAGYANFLVVNDAVMVPIYDDPADAAAMEIIGSAFPGREMVGVDASTLILQGGALHCAAMQIPKGVCP